MTDTDTGREAVERGLAEIEGRPTTVSEDWCIKTIRALMSERDDLQHSYDDMRRLTRKLDVALHGEDGAAQQASLCDLIGPASDLRAERDALQAENERLREAIQGAGVNLWDRAEISERDDAGNQTILLWHPSGVPLVQLRVEAFAPHLEPTHLDLVMSDMLDVFHARTALKAPAD